MDFDEAPLTLDPPIFYGIFLKCFSMRSRFNFRLSLYSIALNSKNEKLAPKRIVKNKVQLQMDFDEALLTLEPPIFYHLSLMLFNEMQFDLLIDLSLSLSPPGVFKISSENFPQKNDHNF